jgi:serine/threonine protein kinase/Tfp pilus assembly protein PilF
MPLTAGHRIGPFEIIAPLGAGGMGEVYRARDTRLGRDVALKSLPPGYATDADRMARFDREARLLAALSHPNIAGIHGLEDAGGTPYLVLEIVEGETLAQHLARGVMPVREVLEMGGQIAAAIEAAHERGIVHRDLKPGNVMISASRVVKVLDFGLARDGALEAASSADLSVSPTLALSATGTGVILGTAPYMSPEQARGLRVDRRADVWAFGCILFECLSGRQCFAGGTVSDVIARILEREPDWNALPPSTPKRLTDLVRRCLTKDLDERPRDIGDLKRELSAIAQELSAPSASSSGAHVGTPSLAVLYFENLAKDPESEYFCAGITEDILTDLSKIKGLRVSSRNAVARYRGASVEIPKVAAELGVKAVLEGSVRRAGDRVRISAQLINAADGFHLWAERYDRKLDDVFAVQEEIASSIAEALRVTLSPAETQALVKDRPQDVRAYDLYLKGREHYGRYHPEAFRSALDLFEQAIQLDANYALAWAGIADCYSQMVQWEVAPDRKEAVRLALEAARRALAINPRLAEGYKAEALALRCGGDIEGERASLLKAIEVNSRFTPALINLAVDDFCRANLASAERLVRRTLEIDPQEAFATVWLGFLCKHTRRDDECLAAATRLRQISSDPFYITAVHGFRAWVLVDRGDFAGAEQAVRAALADGAPADSMKPVGLAIAARSDRLDEARAMLRELEAVRGVGGGFLVLAAEAALRVGDPDLATRLLSREVIRHLAPVTLRLFPGLHALADRAPFAPRRWDVTLKWPLEAPMIDAACHALFKEVRIESGRPQGSDVAAS